MTETAAGHGGEGGEVQRVLHGEREVRKGSGTMQMAEKSTTTLPLGWCSQVDITSQVPSMFLDISLQLVGNCSCSRNHSLF